jgi:hypothetical protein
MPLLLPLILLGLLGFTLWGNTQPAPSEDGMTVVKQKARLQWDSQTSGGMDKADVYTEFTSNKSGERLGVGLFDGGRELRIRDEDVGNWTYESARYTFLWDTSTLDIGAWVAARPDADPPADIGIRLSPVRTLYGLLSPDLLVGSRSAGVGASIYVPPGWIPRSWDRFGLGLGYLVDYGGDGSGWAPYVSLSTRF